MADISGLLYVQTDEIGRPTGIVAAGPTDVIPSGNLPKDVTDTVEIVKVSNVSGNYPAWNTVSSVSGLSALGPVSTTLLNLPADFSSLEVSVGEISAVVETIDPTAINSVSSTVLDNSGNWQSTYTGVNSASSNWENSYNYLNGGASASLSNFIDNSGALAFKSTVDTADIEASAITSATIDGGAITTDKIGDQQITNRTIKQGAVSGPKLADSAVSGSKLANSAVTNAKLANSAVTFDKLQDVSADGHPSFVSGSYTNTNLIVDAKGRIVSATDGTGGGGGGGLSDASALVFGVGAGGSNPSGVAISGLGTGDGALAYGEDKSVLTYRSDLGLVPGRFVYEVPALIIKEATAGLVTPGGEGLTFNFGASAGTQVKLDASGGQFTTSGLSKTLLEFDDKSRVALGRSSVPLEISALGQSDIRLEDDGTNGAFVYVKGSDAAPSLIHLDNVDLSANADSQIDIDTDITLGATAHLDGNTLGAIHIACKNTQGTSVSGGTPVYITGNVGGSNKIEIGVASASVASSMPAVGILSEDLANNAEGYVDAFGIASLLDTSLFASGDTLYVAPTGGLTNVRPTATTDLVQNIGIVELSDATNGKIIVLGPGRTNDVPNDVIRGFNRFEFTDFHAINNNANSPFIGAAVNGGNTSLSIANYAWATTGAGWHVIRSGSSADSGYRWDTQAQRTGIATNQKFRAIFNTHNNNTDRMAWFGMKTAALETTVTNGIYWELSGLSFTPVCKRSNASPTEVLGTTQTLSDDTTYIAEFSITDSSNVLFSLYSAPTENDLGSLIHSETVTISTTWSSAIPMRVGMAATHTGAIANQHMLAIDYMGFGFE